MPGIRQVDIGELGGKDEGDKEKPTTQRARDQAKREEKGLGERLRECFDRIADALEQRGDPELAEVMRDDAQVMAGGLMSLTRPFKPVRTVLVLLVSVVEPALAFGRILRVLAHRWAERRTTQTEHDTQAAQTHDYPLHEQPQ